MKKILVIAVQLVLGAFAVLAQPITLQGTFEGRIGLHVLDDFAGGSATARYVLTNIVLNGNPVPGVVTLVLPAGLVPPVRGTLVASGTLQGDTLTIATIHSMTGPTEGLVAPDTDPFRTLVMLVNLSDVSQPCALADVESQWFADPVDSLETWFEEQSYDRFHLDADVVGPLTIGSSSSTCSPSKWANQADQIARTLVPDFDAYDTYYYVLPGVKATGGALCPGVGGEAKGDRAWSYGACNDHIYGHELGHNLGLQHSATEDRGLGDQSCIMGGNTGGHDQLRHYNAPHKVELDWLVPSLGDPADPGSTYGSVAVSGLYSVYTLEQKFPGEHAVLRIAAGANTDYNISYRTATTHFGESLLPQYRDKLSIHESTQTGGTILRHQDSAGDPGYPTLYGDGETFSDAGFCITLVQHTATRSDVWVSFECAAPPPLCPAVDPCPFVGCIRTVETGSQTTGHDRCVDPQGQLLQCAAGQTVHTVTYACARAACCSQFPGCLCSNNPCPIEGTYVECR